MLQRLGLMATLLHEPTMIILDEPLSGLDPIGRREFKDIILSLRQEGKTIFFSSHIVPDVEEICHKVVVLEKGELIYCGKIEELLAKNANPKFCIKITGGNIPSPLEKYYNGEKEILEVPPEEKDQALALIVASNCSITYLYQYRPDLEKIIYHL